MKLYQLLLVASSLCFYGSYPESMQEKKEVLEREKNFADYYYKDLQSYPDYYDLECKQKISFDALDLLTSWRLDIIARYIYAKQRELGVQSKWHRELYGAFLAVLTDSKELWPAKNCFEDFLNSFHTLIDSIKKDGFNLNTSCIPINSKKLILDGAHRVAACLLLQKKVACEVLWGIIAPCCSGEALRNCRWNIKEGLAEKYLDAMALEYNNLKKNTYCVNIFPAARSTDSETEKILRAYGHIIYKKKVTLYNNGPTNFINYIYAEQPDQPWTDENNNFYGATDATKARFPDSAGTIRAYLFECDSLDKVLLCKKELQALFGIEAPAVHITNTHQKTIELAQLLFNTNSIHFLNYSKHKNFEQFEQLLKKYKQWLDADMIDRDCFCIDDSAVLAAYGIKDCTHLNFIHHGYDTHVFSSESSDISDHNTAACYHESTLDDIIFNPKNHFYYKGVKCASLDTVKKMKMKREQDVDTKDIVLIENHCANCS
ncbi:hypothetical protein CVU75_03105 [Candidatus Dependentiae bacterium HGW-Dependentiae-1]|nr:MAG: hypothetical protein CVU75_03105 [Candidatus Dependentiae bacterium HGW-Dependentiae-1]